MQIQQHRLGSMANFGYLLIDEATHEAVVIDPSLDARPLEQAATAAGARITLIINTHGHPDHVRENARLARVTGAKIAAHALSKVKKDIALEDGQKVRFGRSELLVVHTPGHTPDSCCFVGAGAVFTGDTLFIGECGRVDLPGSDVNAMYHSLLVTLRGLPDQLLVYPGHDYGKTPTSTVGEEKANNRTMALRSPEEFAHFMNEP